jgi:hypothetical protein
MHASMALLRAVLLLTADRHLLVAATLGPVVTEDVCQVYRVRRCTAGLIAMSTEAGRR